jgi:hypothetical protein
MIFNRFLSWVDVVHLITPDGSLVFLRQNPCPDKSMEKINRIGASSLLNRSSSPPWAISQSLGAGGVPIEHRWILAQDSARVRHARTGFRIPHIGGRRLPLAPAPRLEG